ncbi:MAG: hypothetical protein QM776_11265 [Rhodocyclaceae bacterium]
MSMKPLHTLMLAGLLVFGASANAEIADKARAAKDATVDAAKKTGEVVADTATSAASAVATTGKKVGKKTAEVAVKVLRQDQAGHQGSRRCGRRKDRRSSRQGERSDQVVQRGLAPRSSALRRHAWARHNATMLQEQRRYGPMAA